MGVILGLLQYFDSDLSCKTYRAIWVAACVTLVPSLALVSMKIAENTCTRAQQNNNFVYNCISSNNGAVARRGGGEGQVALVWGSKPRDGFAAKSLLGAPRPDPGGFAAR